MKKVLATGLLAICALALTEQQASAWVNARFGIGLNYQFQSGGNSAGWGLWRNGQPPGPEALSSGPFQPYGPVFGGYTPSYIPYSDAPIADPSFYAMPQPAPVPSYGPPVQFATYPRPVYYYYGR